MRRRIKLMLLVAVGSLLLSCTQYLYNEKTMTTEVINKTALMKKTDKVLNGQYWNSLEDSDRKKIFFHGIITGVKLMQQQMYKASSEYYKRFKQQKNETSRAIAVELAYRPQVVGKAIEGVPAIQDLDVFYTDDRNVQIPIFEAYIYLLFQNRTKAKGEDSEKKLERLQETYPPHHDQG